MPQFVTAVNRRGAKQRIPAAWLDDNSPFADQFRLPPSARASQPTLAWTRTDLRAWAAKHHIELGNATTKAAILAALTAHN